MSVTQTRILELFRTLTLHERRELIAQLNDAASASSAYEGLTAEQSAALDAGIEQAERGDTIPAKVVFIDWRRAFIFPTHESSCPAASRRDSYSALYEAF